MSHPANPQTSEGAEPVKVNDRRRFHEDGSPREDAVHEPMPATDAEVVRLQQELEAARKRVDELARAWQAGERDREEYKRRVAREREQLLDVERGNIALALLEAIDQLDLALSTADESPLKKGVRLIRENLVRKAEATGIEPVTLEGQPFDPNLAEATDMEITTHEAEDGRVVAVHRTCYALKGRVIRPGQVKVARYVKPAQA
jgi:molecular chaperone GrpE